MPASQISSNEMLSHKLHRQELCEFPPGIRPYLIRENWRDCGAFC